MTLITSESQPNHALPTGELLTSKTGLKGVRIRGEIGAAQLSTVHIEKKRQKKQSLWEKDVQTNNIAFLRLHNSVYRLYYKIKNGHFEYVRL